MNVFAVSLVKNEADVIVDTIHHLLDEAVDGIIVADNGSDDGTRDLLADIADEYFEVTVVDDPGTGYYQSRKMTGLAQQAADRGADWIIPFDADELWFAHGAPLGETLREVGQTLRIIRVPLVNHYPTGLDDPTVKRPFQRMEWRWPEIGALPKVCVRWRQDCTIHQGNHGASFECGVMPHEDAAVGFEIRHFPYRTAEQFVSKAVTGAKAYAATDLPADQGAHWRQYGDIVERHGENALREVFDEHFFFLSPADSGLICDPAPFRRWQKPDDEQEPPPEAVQL